MKAGLALNMATGLTKADGQQILIVDDDLKILEVTEMILEKEGYRVRAAENGQKALELLNDVNVDLVLLDIKLPDTDGYSLCKIIKNNEETRDVPVILLTSLDGIDNKVKGLDVGASDYLVKPFLQKELLARIRSHLREREFTREVRSLYSIEKRRTHELSILNKLTTEFNQCLDPDELLQKAVRVISTGFGYRGCAMLVREEEKGPCSLKAFYHAILREALPIAQLRWQSQVLDQVIAEKKALIVPDLGAEPETLRLFPDSLSQMAVPLINLEKVVGVLVVETNLAHSYSTDDLNLLSTVAGNLALALWNAELYQASQLQSETLQGLVRQRTREIENQKKLMESIIDSLPLGIYVIDREYGVVTWNKKRETGILGIPRDQVVGKDIFTVFPAMVKEKLKLEFDQVWKTAQPFETETVSWSSGEKRHYHIRKIPMSMEGDQTTHVITLAEDVSERKKLEESLFTNAKLASLGRLAAGIAHEINNPLAAIAGCVEGLISRSREPELARAPGFEDFPEYLKIIDDEILRCKGIINNLLDFSRTREILHQSVNINETIEQTLQLLSHHKSFRRVQVVKELDPELPPLVGNSGELRQVLLAMAMNAVDAMDEAGTMTLRSCRETRNGQEHVCLHVQDTGVGIPPKNLNKIFDPFFTTKPVGKGVGLGLSICYGIVRSHHGFIKVASEEGKGTLFQIYLPVTPPKEQEA